MSGFLSVARVLAFMLMIFSTTMLLPLALAWWSRDGAHYAYDEGILITLGVGALLWAISRKHHRELQIRDGFLLVVLTWTVLPIFGAIPLYSYIHHLSWTDAYFEAVSGLTASGGTVLSGLDHLPFSINFWRAEMVWLGGMGLIVLAVAILPLLGVGGRQIFKAEAPGPMKESKLTPRMAETAKGLWSIYVVITAACCVSLRWAGMSWGDAIIHSFTAVGLGGFSSYDASIGHFDSVLIESILIVFMLISGLNYATHFLAVRGRSLRAYVVDAEARWFLLVIFASILLLTSYLWSAGTYPDFETALRYAAFNTVSVATTTGYATTDYGTWPFFAPLWMLFLCSFATCSGSTGGGIKMVRAIILYKQVFREIVRALHPAAVHPVKFGNEAVPSNILFAVLAFGFMYMVILVSMTLVMSFTGLDIVTAFSAVVACVNNTGPGLNEVGPATTFKSLTDVQIWLCTFCMLLGRLEIFTLLVVLSPAFWRK